MEKSDDHKKKLSSTKKAFYETPSGLATKAAQAEKNFDTGEHWVVTDPKGSSKEIRSIREWAAANGFNPDVAYTLARRRGSYQGYKFKRKTPE